MSIYDIHTPALPVFGTVLSHPRPILDRVVCISWYRVVVDRLDGCEESIQCDIDTEVGSETRLERCNSGVTRFQDIAERQYRGVKSIVLLMRLAMRSIYEDDKHTW